MTLTYVPKIQCKLPCPKLARKVSVSLTKPGKSPEVRDESRAKAPQEWREKMDFFCLSISALDLKIETSLDNFPLLTLMWINSLSDFVKTPLTMAIKGNLSDRERNDF